ncbi:MAG: ECF transporter S component [Oscillospiraceae bacterium]|jgi:uncharacterized membrane protein|nr:ECF transporter S component [Oscillospiraceae bacterium]
MRDTRRIVLLATLTAIVIVLQLFGAFIRFGPFSVSLVLMPIAVGSALLGVFAGGWLGLIFGIVVLATGDANVFITIDPFGAIFTVLAKGIFAGLSAGVAYKLLSKFSKTLGAVAAAIICPIVNTGIFVLGMYVFFFGTLTEWSMAAEVVSATAFLFITMIGLNFFIELGLNTILSPVIVRLIQFGESKNYYSLSNE